jgi:transcriptional regulator with XRE-family HTH domain
MNNKARKHNSSKIKELLAETTPLEKVKARNKMLLAARIWDLVQSEGWNKTTFADKAGKEPSEITKWLSGTHNFTHDTLTEISVVLDVPISELFVSKQSQIITKTQFFVLVGNSDATGNYPKYNAPIPVSYTTHKLNNEFYIK